MSGRVVIERGSYWQFFLYAPDLVESVYYYSDGNLSNVRRRHFQDGRMVSLEAASAPHISDPVIRTTTETYTYDGDRIVRIDVDHHPKDGRWESSYDHDYAVTYDDAGLLEIRLVEPYRARSPLYQRPPKGKTVPKLLATIRDNLLKLIPETVANQRVSEPVCALAIVYNDHHDMHLPPWLALATERERNEWLPQGDIGRLWNPAEYTAYPGFVVPEDDTEFKDACRLADQEMGAREEWHLGLRMLNDVAAKLASRDWSPMPTTEDFILFAIDVEGEDLEDNLLHSVSAELVQRFRAAKWF